MAIQMRRGLKADFDPTKMVAGEWAVATDSATNNNAVWICYSTGRCARIATEDDIMGLLQVATYDTAGIVQPSHDYFKIDENGLLENREASTTQKGVTIVDDVLNALSINPVQNKALRKAIMSTIGWYQEGIQNYWDFFKQGAGSQWTYAETTFFYDHALGYKISKSATSSSHRVCVSSNLLEYAKPGILYYNLGDVMDEIADGSLEFYFCWTDSKAKWNLVYSDDYMEFGSRTPLKAARGTIEITQELLDYKSTAERLMGWDEGRATLNMVMVVGQQSIATDKYFKLMLTYTSVNDDDFTGYYNPDRHKYNKPIQEQIDELVLGGGRIATSTTVGFVKPDNTTTTVNEAGEITVISGGSGGAVDTELSTTSTNAVQNKVINKGISDVSNSATNRIEATIGWSQGSTKTPTTENICNTTITSGKYKQYGSRTGCYANITVNSDKSITINNAHLDAGNYHWMFISDDLSAYLTGNSIYAFLNESEISSGTSLGLMISEYPLGFAPNNHSRSTNSVTSHGLLDLTMLPSKKEFADMYGIDESQVAIRAVLYFDNHFTYSDNVVRPMLSATEKTSNSEYVAFAFTEGRKTIQQQIDEISGGGGSVTLDDTVSDRSSNGVKSSGIATALKNTIGWYQNEQASYVVNELRLDDTSTTINGITVASNRANGTITVSGTATSSNNKYIALGEIMLQDDEVDGSGQLKSIEFYTVTGGSQEETTTSMSDMMFLPVWYYTDDQGNVISYNFYQGCKATYNYANTVQHTYYIYTKTYAASYLGVDKSVLKLGYVLYVGSTSGEVSVTLHPIVSKSAFESQYDFKPYGYTPSEETRDTIQKQIDDLFVGGTSGQFAVSDGNGGITWVSLTDASEVQF